MRLSELNALEKRDFVALLGGVFEHSPWVAERAWRRRPFQSVEELHRAMLDAVFEATPEEQLSLARAHPELAGKEATQGELTAHSTSEQDRLGFTSLTREEVMKMAEINGRYRERHGFPCIVALRLHGDRASVMAEMERRLEEDSEAELRRALEQIGHITRGRLDKIVRPA